MDTENKRNMEKRKHRKENKKRKKKKKRLQKHFELIWKASCYRFNPHINNITLTFNNHSVSLYQKEEKLTSINTKRES